MRKKQAIPSQLAQQIAYNLSQKYDVWSFLIHEKNVYYSTYKRLLGEPRSATVNLIQDIHSKLSPYVLRIVRNRIYTNVKLTEMCKGFVKVAAHRVSDSFEGLDTGIDISGFHYVELGTGSISKERSFDVNTCSGFDDANWMNLAEKLSKKTDRTKSLYECDRQVAALLVSAENELLSIGINENASNKTLHAEVNLIQSFYERHKKPIPTGSTIYTTLKPCKMCAGMILTCAENIDGIRIVYKDFDHGTLGRFTVFDKLKPQLQIQQSQTQLLLLDR